MFIVTEVKKKHYVASASKDQVNQFMTDPNLSVNGSVYVVSGEQDLVSEFKGPELVNLYNDLSNSELKKFKDKFVGAERTYPLLKEKALSYEEFLPAIKGVARSKRPIKGMISLDPRKNVREIYPCRAGSKQAALIDALKKGATMEDLIVVCSKVKGGKSWSESSVKSGIYWDVNKLKGYGIRTEMNNKGIARYFLTYPEGMTAPVPHTPRRKT